MVDKISAKLRSANMARIRSKNTKPEMIVRRLSHALGYRHRLHRKNLPGKPDLVYPGKRAVVFVHGCFWHQHPDEHCLDGRLPKSRQDYWIPKLQRNVERDRKNRLALEADGWKALIIWECQTKDPESVAAILQRFLSE